MFTFSYYIYFQLFEVHVHTSSRGLIKNITGLWRVSKTNDAVILTTEWFKGLKNQN